MIDASWYIIVVRSSEDKEVESRLAEAGIFALSFFSEKSVKHHRTKKELKKTAPLFPSYLFVQCGPADWSGIKQVNGVVRFLHAADHTDEDKTPMVIDPYLVYSLLAKERAGAFRVGKHRAVVDLGDVVQCEVLGQITQGTVIESNEEGAVLETFLNGMRVVLNKDASELRAA